MPPVLVAGLNRGDHGAGDFRSLCKAFLGEPAVLAPDFSWAFPGNPALSDLERYQLVFAALKTALNRIVSLHVGKHLRVVHQLLKVVHRDHRELFALAGNFFEKWSHPPESNRRPADYEERVTLRNVLPFTFNHLD
jgi:hypothetical protein